MQAQLQANYAFAQIVLPNEVTGASHNVKNSTILSSTVDEKNKKSTGDIILPDIFGSDTRRYTIQDSNESPNIGNQSINTTDNSSRDIITYDDSKDYVDNRSSEIIKYQNNQNPIIEAESTNQNHLNVSSTETQPDHLDSINDLENIDDRNPVSDDVPNSNGPETTPEYSQQNNKSHPNSMINSEANRINEELMDLDNAQEHGLSSMRSGMNPSIGNEYGDNDPTNFVTEDASATFSAQNYSEFNGSEFPTGSTLKYSSYSDFIDKNGLSGNENKTKTSLSPEILRSESASFANTSNINGTTNQQAAKNASNMQTYSASASSQVSSLSSGKAYGDFNGDGKDDLAIGVPFEDVSLSMDAGAVHVIYGSATGLSATNPRSDQFWNQDTPDVDDIAEKGDSFGRALSAGDFNGDGKDDLAIGVPSENQGNLVNSGGVEVLYGSSKGLSATIIADQFWTQDSPDVEGGSELDDSFGSSVSAGDFNGDGIDDLAIGVPDEDLGTIEGAGGVQIIYGSSDGLSAVLPRADQFWTQDNPEVDGASEIMDHFGDSISSGDFNSDGIADLAVGIPYEDSSGVGQAGAVQVIYGSVKGLSATLAHADQFWSQDSPNIENGVEYNDLFGSAVSAGDYNGDGIDDLAIGSPAEGLGPIEGAGAINVIYGSTEGLSATAIPDQFWSQDSYDVASIASPFENFGVSLSGGDFNGDGMDDLAIGVPGEHIDSIPVAGAVHVLYGSSAGLSPTLTRPDQFWTQDTPEVENGAEIDDLFGASLSTGDFDGSGRDDLVIGVPGEDLGVVEDAGAAEVLYGSPNGASATLARSDQFWTQDTVDIADMAGESDGFGNTFG